MAGISALFGIDTRSLALIRIVIAVGFLIVLPLHGITGSGPVTTILLPIVAFIAALTLAFGYRSRISAVVLWAASGALLFGDVGSFPGSNNGLTGVLILLSAVPCGTAYSVDCAMGWQPKQSRRVTSLATAALAIQVTLTLVASFLTPSADQSAASLAMLYLTVACVLIPTWAWDRASNWALGFHSNGLRIYYDRDCGFCYKTTLLFRTFLLLGDTQIEPAQSKADVEKILLEHNSWVVYDRDGSVHLRWHAVLLLLRRSALMRPIGLFLTAIRMGYWGDIIYATIGASRGFFSKLTAILLPLPTASPTMRKPNSMLPIAWLVTTLLFNIYRVAVSDPGMVGLLAYSAGVIGLFPSPS